MEALFQRVRMARLAGTQAEDARDALDTQVRELIGTKAGILGMFGKVTYRPSSGRTDWKLLAGTYRKAADRLAALLRAGAVDEDVLDALASIQDQVEAAQGLYTKPGSRTLRYDFAEGATEDE
jgi:hypothetical protein